MHLPHHVQVELLGNVIDLCIYRWNLPTIFGYGAFVCTTRYLVCQGIVRPQVVSSATVLLLHPIVNWICIYGLGTDCKLADTGTHAVF